METKASKKLANYKINKNIYSIYTGILNKIGPHFKAMSLNITSLGQVICQIERSNFSIAFHDIGYITMYICSKIFQSQFLVRWTIRQKMHFRLNVIHAHLATPFIFYNFFASSNPNFEHVITTPKLRNHLPQFITVNKVQILFSREVTFKSFIKSKTSRLGRNRRGPLLTKFFMQPFRQQLLQLLMRYSTRLLKISP